MTDLALIEIFAAVARAVPSRTAVAWRSGITTFDQLWQRVERLATFLRNCGIGFEGRLPEVRQWESPQDHVAILARNRPEWIEAMLACYGARAVPFNVNYHYTARELGEVLKIGRPRAVIYEATYAPLVAQVRSTLGDDVVLIEVADESEWESDRSAHDYESAIQNTSRIELPHSQPDDRYLLFTGGTTGRPKGVLWRQADIYAAALRGFRKVGDAEVRSVSEIASRAKKSTQTILPAPPLMHGAAQWAALSALLAGHTVVLADTNTRFDAAELIELVERWGVDHVVIGGDAYARPLIDALDGRVGAMPSLEKLTTGAVALTPAAENEIRKLLPHVRIYDSAGASETGPQMQRRGQASAARPNAFTPGVGTCVVSADRSRPLTPDSREIGWLARSGRAPLGYLDEPELTARTFPLISGVRYAIPGDRARYVDGGDIELLGRESSVINTGGEKVFAEEVEQTLCDHPAVVDAIVVGCPHERWGNEVVAVVALRPTVEVSAAELQEFTRGRLARYKVPKRIVTVDAVKRSAAGKPDYRWAREQARLSAPHESRAQQAGPTFTHRST